MILKETKYGEVGGNVPIDEEFNITVNTTKTNKLFNILLESYKNSRAAMIREYTSNAWDAQKEAGKEHEPVVVAFDEDDGGYFISFQDTGIGMSHEFFRESFSKLLTSTKEETNESIGGFGIGSKTALAYTTNFHVETIKDGELNYYIIYKETSSIPRISRLISEPTDRQNGVMVKVYVKDKKELSTLVDVARQELAYFDNVVFRSNIFYVSDYNVGKILEGKYFKYRTTTQYSDDMHLVLGKVAYPIDWRELGMSSASNIVSVGVHFDIGELQVNMTRESILYTDEAKALIKHKIELAKTELIERINKQNKPIENILDYVELKTDRQADLKPTMLELKADGISYYLSLYSYRDSIFQKQYGLAKRLGLNSEVINYDYIPFRVIGTITNGKIVVKKRDDRSLLRTKLPVVLVNTLELSKDFMAYIQNCVLVTDNNQTSFAKRRNMFLVSTFAKNTVRQVDLNSRTSVLKIRNAGEIGKAKKFYALEKQIRKTITDSFIGGFYKYSEFVVPQSWKDEQKRIARENRLLIQKASGVISVKDYLRGNRYDLDLGSLNSFTGIIIYGFQQNRERLELIKDIMVKHLNFRYRRHDKPDTLKIYQIAQNNETPFTILKNKNAIHVNQFIMSNNRIMSRLYTLHRIEKYLDFLKQKNYIYKINTFIGMQVEALYDYRIRHSSNRLDRMLLNEDFIKELEGNAKLLKLGDKSVLSQLNEVEKYFKGLEVIGELELHNKAVFTFVVESLKAKGKKVNYYHYNNTSEVQVKKEIIRTPWVGGLIERPFQDLKQYNNQKPTTIYDLQTNR